MDWDAWGSLGGLALVLRYMWKDVHGINDENVPGIFNFLWNSEIIDPNLDVWEFDPDIIISLDASDEARLWESYIKWKDIFDEKTLIVIDHHVSNPWFGDINIIDPEASSVCEMLTHIITDLELQKYVSPEAATFLYTGLQTDSNMYFNTNTRPSTLRAGATLMELWADFRLPVSELYKKRTANQMRVWQYALSHICYRYNGKVCSVVLDRNWLNSLWLEESELSGCFKWFISEILINISGVKIAYLLYPLSTGINKISTRSQEWYNVAEICETFGWGWHKQAAWFESNDKVDVIEELLKKEIQKQIT